MKHLKLVILTLLALISVQLIAQVPPENTIKWVDWNSGYQQAQQQGKIIILDLYTEWCGWCKKMDKETFTHPEIIQLISAGFIPIKMNPEQANIYYIYKGKKVTGKQLLAILDKNQGDISYPAIIFIYPQTDEVYSEIGYQKASVFRELLKAHIQEFEKLSSRASK